MNRGYVALGIVGILALAAGVVGFFVEKPLNGVSGLVCGGVLIVCAILGSRKGKTGSDK